MALANRLAPTTVYSREFDVFNASALFAAPYLIMMHEKEVSAASPSTQKQTTVGLYTNTVIALERQTSICASSSRVDCSLGASRHRIC
jgi:hypothetical protein